MKIIRILLLLGLVSCGPGSSDSVFIPAEYSSTVSGSISFFSEDGGNYIIVSSVDEEPADNDDVCPISMEQGRLSYQIDDQDSDTLVLEDQELKRVDSPTETPSVSGVNSSLFGTWQFPPSTRSNGMIFTITVELQEEKMIYKNTCTES